jgi:hypothetical protein
MRCDNDVKRGEKQLNGVHCSHPFLSLPPLNKRVLSDDLHCLVTFAVDGIYSILCWCVGDIWLECLISLVLSSAFQLPSLVNVDWTFDQTIEEFIVDTIIFSEDKCIIIEF